MSEIDPNTQPLELFEHWMARAKADSRIKEPTAMAVATSNAAGEVHTRVVLCKEWSNAGFVFYTNYQSQKGHDLAEHPRAAAVFYWDPLFQQIKISGSVKKTSRADSEAYWNSRPRESQLSQWLSHQSEPVASREVLEKAWHEADQKFKSMAVPCPAHWGGYVIEPQSIEFWTGQAGRLHDRLEFTKTEKGWTSQRLYP